MKSRKGISPILVTLLLIMIAVTAITVTYAWIMAYMGNTTDKAGVMLYEANTRFYTNSQGAKTIDINVGNSGTSDAVVKAIYIGTASANMASQTIPSQAVSAGGASTTFTVAYTTWVSGTTYYFKVVPSSGSPLTFDVRAP